MPFHPPPCLCQPYVRTLEGFWERLLTALAAAPKRHPLRDILGPICRATRRAIRLRGLGLVVLARRLGLTRALPAPPWLCPDPDLSEIVFAMPILPQFPVNPREIKIACRRLRDIQRLLTTAAGRSYISPILKACWP